MTHEGEQVAGPVPHSRWFLVALAVLLLYVAFRLVRPYLGAVVLAILIGFLMQPLHVRLLRVVRSPSLAATLGVLLVTLALVLPLAFIVAQLRDEAAMVVAFVQDAEGLQTSLAGIAARLGVEPAAADSFVQRALGGLAGAIQSAVGPTITAAVNVLAGLVLFFFLLFFVLRDGSAFLRAIRRLAPVRERERDRLFQLVAARTRAIALGTFLVSLAQGIAAGLGWWFFGFPAPVFWGFVMTVIAVLPLGAPFLVLVPAGLIALAQGDTFAGIGILLWSGLVVGLLDNVLRPFLVGRGTDVHPAVILVGTIGGLTVFGISGFLLGPLLLSLLGPVLEVWAADARGSHPPA